MNSGVPNTDFVFARTTVGGWYWHSSSTEVASVKGREVVFALELEILFLEHFYVCRIKVSL
jgi:hypothetical protein